MGYYPDNAAAIAKQRQAQIAAEHPDWEVDENGNPVGPQDNSTADFGGVGNVVNDMFSAEDANQPDTKAQPTQYGGQPGGAQAETDYWRSGTQEALGRADDVNARAGEVATRAGEVQDRQGPTVNTNDANYHAVQAGQSRGQGQTDTETLRRQAAAIGDYAAQGPGESAAQAQLKLTTDENMAQALALARSGRGAGENAAALRGAMGQRADMQQKAAAESAVVRAQEADAWRGRQLQALGMQTDAQQGVMGFDAQQRAADLQAQGMSFDEAMQQANLEMESRKTNDAMELGLYGAETGMYGAEQGFYGAGAQFGQLGQAPQLAQLESDTAIQEANAQNALNARLGNQQADLEKDTGIFGMVGGLFGSDERMKEDKGRARILDAIGEAKGYRYRYKPEYQDEANGDGVHYGPMAQDLAKTPEGRSTLRKDESGMYRVDTGRLALLDTSAIAEQQEEIEELKRRVAAL